MKFRTDFVTNSSSTSYVSITFFYKDKPCETVYDADFDGECLSFLGFRKGKENIELPISSLDDVLEALDLLYNSVFADDNFKYHIKNALNREKDVSNIDQINIKTVNSDTSTETTQTLIANLTTKLLSTSSVFEDLDDDY